MMLQAGDMIRSLLKWIALAGICSAYVRADDLSYSYDGNVVPQDPSAGWIVFNQCAPPCKEFLNSGSFELHWPEPNDLANYHKWIARSNEAPPPSLWVEWRFRSNHPMPPHSYTCDGDLSILYRNVHDILFMHGDAVVSFSGSSFVLDLPNNEFRTYRFESPDGESYWFSVDGLVFLVARGNNSSTNSYIQMGGRGGCLDDWIPNMENAWDFVRYGEIEYGEPIVGADPPVGFIDAQKHPALDRFTIRYETANYVYLDEITVQVADKRPSQIDKGGSPVDAPAVVATRRLDNGPADVVEIVLDRPIPYNAITHFTIDDGTLAQSIEYAYAPGDVDGDGVPTLGDFAVFQNCFESTPVGVCSVFDFDANGEVDLLDFEQFVAFMLE